MKRPFRGAFLSWAVGTLMMAIFVVWSDAQAGDNIRPVEPASTFVNQAIHKKLTQAKVPCSAVADDAEFLRRVYLDLTGRIPTLEQAVRFLDSKDADKRRKLVDELLASPNFGKHFANVWTTLIYSGDIDPPQNVKQAELTAWLATQFNAGRGWDKIVQDLITAEGNAPQAIFTIINGDNGKPGANKLAGASSKLFLGVQLQCAECHNHPFAKWKQKEFWGMAAFFGQVQNGGAAKKGKGTGGVAESTSAVKAAKKGAAIATQGPGTIVIPNTAGKLVGAVVKARYLEGAEPTLPTGPLRPTLAKWMTAPENPFFAKASANRLWYQMFGRGLVQPVDDMHEENACSHPEVLDKLAQEFKASGFDVKHLLRVICNSEPYQRTSKPLPGNKDDDDHYARMNVKAFTPDMLYDSLCVAMSTNDINVATGRQPTTGRQKGTAKGGNPRERFVKFFSTRDDNTMLTEYTDGIPQILAMLNTEQLNKGGGTVDQIVKAKTPEPKAIETLFLATLSRRPTTEDMAIMTKYLSTRQSQPAAERYSGMLWILINTSEFTLNH
jgi:hypothetical protein